MASSAPSFANDIAPIFYKYRGQMAWRLDLASYDDVKANALIIAGMIAPGDPPDSGKPPTPPQMPPPPFPPFPQSFVNQFQAWIAAGYPP